MRREITTNYDNEKADEYRKHDRTQKNNIFCFLTSEHTFVTCFLHFLGFIIFLHYST